MGLNVGPEHGENVGDPAGIGARAGGVQTFGHKPKATAPRLSPNWRTASPTRHAIRETIGVMSEAGRKTGTYGRFYDQRALAALAGRQHDVFTLAQLQDLGLTASAVHKRAASGRLHRVHHGVYSLAPAELLSRRGRYMAAVLACGPGAVLSHRSAAALHELRATDRTGIDVTISGRTNHNRPGIDVHRSCTLSAGDTTTVDGIPCTTVSRTLLDLAGVVGRRPTERAI